MNSIDIILGHVRIIEIVERSGDDGGKEAHDGLRTYEAATAMAVAIQDRHGMIEHMENAKGQASGLLARDRNARLVSGSLRLTNGLPGRGQRSGEKVEDAKERRDIHQNKVIGKVENLQ